MLKIKRLTGSFFAVLLGFGAVGTIEPAIAQMPPTEQSEPVDLTNEHLDRFANAFQAIRTIQQESQEEMIAAVEAEGLTIDEFNTIAQSQDSPAAAEQVSPEQIEQFATAAEQVAAIQTQAQDKIQSAIQAENLTLQEFEQILIRVQQDPSLQAEINQRLQR